MRPLSLALTVVALAILPLLGCGNDEAATSATSLAPAGSVVYAEVALDPEGDQQKAVDAIVSKFPGQGGAGERLRGLIEQGLRESDAPLSFEDDIEPWLGDEAAFFATGALNGGDLQNAAVLLATDDEDASRDAVDKSFRDDPQTSTYKDVEYRHDAESAAAVFDGFVVLGSVAGVKSAIDTADGGASLDDDAAYDAALEEAPEDRLGLVYVNSPKLYDAMRQSAAGALPLGDSFRDFFEEPYVATVDADDDGVTVEATIPESFAKAVPFFSPGSDLVGDLPADSWFALGQPDLGKTLSEYLDAFADAAGGRDVVEQQFRSATGLRLQEDVFDWMGDFGIFVRGATVQDLSGALVVETSDPAASGRLIARIRALVAAGGDRDTSVGPLAVPGEGFTLRTPDVPPPIHVFQRDGKFVVAFGDDAARDAISSGQPLSSSPEFSEASKSLEGYGVSFYLRIDQVLALAEASGAGSDESFQQAKPYLDPLAALIGGTEDDGGDIASAFKVVVR
jgi:Protein of unknown function (DUF3352)